MSALSESQIHLLLTAEKLFAREGVAAVSARRIAQEAGHRNISATLYHFGSKERLINALLAMRMRDINQRREQLLDRLDAHAALPRWLDALVTPLVEQLADPDSHFVGCIEQLYSRSHGDYLYADLDASLTSGLSRAVAGIVPLLGNLPPETVDMRLHLMASQIIHSAADWYHLRERGAKIPRIEQIAQGLIEYIGGGLMAAPINADPENKTASKNKKRAPAKSQQRAKKS